MNVSDGLTAVPHDGTFCQVAIPAASRTRAAWFDWAGRMKSMVLAVMPDMCGGRPSHFAAPSTEAPTAPRVDPLLLVPCLPGVFAGGFLQAWAARLEAHAPSLLPGWISRFNARKPGRCR